MEIKRLSEMTAFLLRVPERFSMKFTLLECKLKEIKMKLKFQEKKRKF